jgi:predicted HD superfamily hydrolase involved in NAD metabolism
MIEQIRDDVRQKLRNHPKRLTHVEAVEKTAVKLARIHQANEDQVRIAAIYHDAMKYASLQDQLTYLEASEIQRFQSAPVMYHALSAAMELKITHGIHDEIILNAIRYHVFGRPFMTVVEKIVFVSDMCEPNRDFLDWQALDQLAQKDLDKAVYEIMVIIASYLKKDHLPLHPLQEEAMKHYKEVCCGQTQKSH